MSPNTKRRYTATLRPESLTTQNSQTDEVNYGPSVKAFLFLLNHDCCVSIDKCRDFLKNLTGGKLDISKGMISRLSKEFAEKSEPKRKSAVSEIYLYPVMHTIACCGK